MENSCSCSRKWNKTHVLLMHSAKQLFEEFGLGNVTIDAITDKADVSRSTFFTHFTSIDDLLAQIADQEIKDVLEAANVDGKIDIFQFIKKLSLDTYPYPNLMCELIVRNILSGRGEGLRNMFGQLIESVDESGFEELLSVFPPKQFVSIIFGAYFGVVFQKLIDREEFSDPEEISNKINKFINYINRQEETK